MKRVLMIITALCGITTTGKLEKQTTDYIYDGLGRLVRRDNSAKPSLAPVKYWTYFGPLRLVESFGDSVGHTRTTLEFFHGIDGPQYMIQSTAQSPGMRDLIDGDSGTRHKTTGMGLHKDHLGSTIALTDEATGNVLYRYYYDPFGQPFVQTPPGSPPPSDILFNPILYTGHYYDGNAEAYLTPFRAYDPALGRFLQRDPLGLPDGPNTYAYVNNSPYAFTDPLGLAAKGNSDFERRAGLKLREKPTPDLNKEWGMHPLTRIEELLEGLPLPPQRSGTDPVANFLRQARGGPGSLTLPPVVEKSLSEMRDKRHEEGFVVYVHSLHPTYLAPVVTDGSPFTVDVYKLDPEYEPQGYIHTGIVVHSHPLDDHPQQYAAQPFSGAEGANITSGRGPGDLKSFLGSAKRVSILKTEETIWLLAKPGGWSKPADSEGILRYYGQSLTALANEYPSRRRSEEKTALGLTVRRLGLKLYERDTWRKNRPGFTLVTPP